MDVGTTRAHGKETQQAAVLSLMYTAVFGPKWMSASVPLLDELFLFVCAVPRFLQPATSPLCALIPLVTGDFKIQSSIYVGVCRTSALVQLVAAAAAK